MSKPLTFKGKQIDLDALKKSFKSMPFIELSKADVRNAELAPCDQAFQDEKNIAVYKHENILYVLCGHAEVNAFLTNDGKNTIKVRLISKQLFKHLTVVSVPLALQNTQASRIEEEMDRQRQQEARAAAASAPSTSYGQRPQTGFRPPHQGDRRPPGWRP